MQLLVPKPSLARELEPSSWTRWDAMGLKHDLWTAPLMHLVFMIAPTLKMQESPVKVRIGLTPTLLLGDYLLGDDLVVKTD